MFQISFFFLLMMNSIIFLFMSHPISMGFILMIQTLLISLFTGTFSIMFWFSYSLFLIFMGGMLILFMYMTSLASNEIFKFNLKINIINLKFLIILISTMIILLMDFKNLIINNKTLNNDLLPFFNNNLMLNNSMTTLNKMYNFPLNLITIMLVNYLFITLIATVKITGIFQGPLRPKNN